MFKDHRHHLSVPGANVLANQRPVFDILTIVIGKVGFNDTKMLEDMFLEVYQVHSLGQTWLSIRLTIYHSVVI